MPNQPKLIVYKNPQSPIPPLLLQQFDKDEVQFNQENDVRINCQRILEWKVREFRCCGVEGVLGSISSILFSHLVDVYIDANKIESIEYFSRINIPFLETLSISQNKIFKIRILRKIISPNLQNLWIDHNKILDGDKLTELPTQNLDSLTIEETAEAQKQCEDARWASKIQSNNLNYFRINSSKRLAQSNFTGTIKKKFLNLKKKQQFYDDY